MNYLKFGNSKKFIVFMHGWGADLNSFLWVKNYIDEYTLIFLDFPGFGKSKAPGSPYSVSDYVNELKLLLDKFDIEILILVGHSFGGRVAIKFSALYQFDFMQFGLVLVDSAGIKPRRSIKYYYKVLSYKIRKKLAKISKKQADKLKNYGSSDYKALSGVMKETFVKVVNEDLKNYAKKIKCSTLIIWGRQDKDTKLYMAKKLNKLINKSELFVLDNAGHFSFLDQPNEFLILLDTYIKKF